MKLDCSIWNFVAIVYRTRDISTFGLAAANGRHLEIPTSGYESSIYNRAVDFMNLENMGEAVGISLLSCLEPEI